MFSMFSSSLLLWTSAIALAIPAYLFYGILVLVIRQSRSPLRRLPGPKSTSWFLGNLKELHDSENNYLIERWVNEHGGTFVYRGFCGVRICVPLDAHH